MKYERFYLRDENKEVTLDCYLHTPSPEMPTLNRRPAVLICPGGGYEICSDREAEPIALCYGAAGYHTFILRYSLGQEAVYPNPLVDLCRAMQLIRRHAEQWGVIADQIALCGFSAGGHLAASLGVHWTEEPIQAAAGAQAEEIRPNALVLCYPVIATDGWMERTGTVERLIGDGDHDRVFRALNLHTCVTRDTPPAFLAHTFGDTCVSVNDSLRFASALQAENIPFELHVWPNGNHGMSLADTNMTPPVNDADFAQWMALSIRWLNGLFRAPSST